MQRLLQYAWKLSEDTPSSCMKGVSRQMSAVPEVHAAWKGLYVEKQVEKESTVSLLVCIFFCVFINLRVIILAVDCMPVQLQSHALQISAKPQWFSFLLCCSPRWTSTQIQQRICRGGGWATFWCVPKVCSLMKNGGGLSFNGGLSHGILWYSAGCPSSLCR